MFNISMVRVLSGNKKAKVSKVLCDKTIKYGQTLGLELGQIRYSSSIIISLQQERKGM